MKKVPSSLRTWFNLHFGIDMVLGLPMLLTPAIAMGFLGFSEFDTLTVRIVGAALIAIGGTSYWIQNEGIEVFRAMLKLKLIWSLSAMVAIMLYIYELGNDAAFVFFGIFLFFSLIWSYYYRLIKK